MYLMEESQEESGKARITWKCNRDMWAGGIIKVSSPLVREKGISNVIISLSAKSRLYATLPSYVYTGGLETWMRARPLLGVDSQ